MPEIEVATPSTPLPRPTGVQVLIKIDPRKETTKGGLHLPEIVHQNAQQANPKQGHAEPHSGTIVAVGDGYVSDYGVEIVCRRKVGERVNFFPPMAFLIEHEGEKYAVIHERQILAVLA